MTIRIVEEEPNYLRFEVSTKFDFVSALRDILLHHIPGVRFAFVSIQENTTILHDELLPIRFNRVPIVIDDPSLIPYPTEGITEENTLTYDINFTARSDEKLTSSSIIPRNPRPDIRVVPNIEILPMKAGQRLQAVLFAQKGIGVYFSPVYLVNSRRKMEIVSPVSQEARDSCKYGVYDIEDFPTDVVPSPDMYDINRCIKCGACTRLGVKMKESSVIMEIRTSGIEPRKALQLAISELRSRGIDIEL